MNEAEYGTFKKKTHILEDTAAEIYKYGLTEVEKGRELFYKSQKQTRYIINAICIVATLWGLFIPILLSRRLTSVILYLTKVSDNISRGKLKEEIMANRKDELGDLARSIKRMQKSLQIMMDRFARASA